MPVVTAPDEIDITNAPELRSALLEAAAHGHGTLVVDMTRTRFCDSSGLYTLLAAHKRAQAEGGELLLAITAAPVLRVLAITSIDRMIPTFTSLDQALAHSSANGSNGHQRADRIPRLIVRSDAAGTRLLGEHLISRSVPPVPVGAPESVSAGQRPVGCPAWMP